MEQSAMAAQRSGHVGSVAVFFASLLLFLALAAAAADGPNEDQPYAPHTPTLIFYLSNADSSKDVDAIRASIQKLKSASAVEVNVEEGHARIRFDSHVVSYHQVAQAIIDSGKSLQKDYDPLLIFIVTDYAKSRNAAKVDSIFSGKRLNSRVHITPLDPSKGVFVVHFLPLAVDPSVGTPQGFNGGHLHHPISDPAPRGLGLTSGYASTYDPIISQELKDAEARHASSQPSDHRLRDRHRPSRLLAVISINVDANCKSPTQPSQDGRGTTIALL